MSLLLAFAMVMVLGWLGVKPERVMWLSIIVALSMVLFLAGAIFLAPVPEVR